MIFTTTFSGRMFWTHRVWNAASLGKQNKVLPRETFVGEVHFLSAIPRLLSSKQLYLLQWTSFCQATLPFYSSTGLNWLTLCCVTKTSDHIWRHKGRINSRKRQRTRIVPQKKYAIETLITRKLIQIFKKRYYDRVSHHKYPIISKIFIRVPFSFNWDAANLPLSNQCSNEETMEGTISQIGRPRK